MQKQTINPTVANSLHYKLKKHYGIMVDSLSIVKEFIPDRQEERYLVKITTDKGTLHRVYGGSLLSHSVFNEFEVEEYVFNMICSELAEKIYCDYIAELGDSLYDLITTDEYAYQIYVNNPNLKYVSVGFKEFINNVIDRNYLKSYKAKKTLEKELSVKKTEVTKRTKI